MRDRFPLVLIAGVLLLGVTGWFLTQGARRGGFADRLSTFKSEPDGARAVYLLAEEAGLDVRRHQQDLEIIPERLNLVMLGTRFASEGEERFEGDAGVDDDHEEDDEEFKARGLNAFRSPSVTRQESEKLLEHVRNGATLLFVPASARDPRLLADLDVGLVRETTKEALTLVPSQPSRYVRGVQRVVTPVRAWLELPPGALPLLEDERSGKPAAALVPYGQGQILILSAPALVMNRTVAMADNAQLWLSLLGTLSADAPLAFDEFHHGFTSSRSIGEFAARYGLQFAVAQLLLGVMLWALALRRFGAPRLPADELRVGSTDALFATSRLYREGRHVHHAAQSIARELAFELALRAGVSGRLEPAEIGAALDVRGRADLAHALLEVSSAAAHATTEADVEHVAALAAALRSTLTHDAPRTPT